MIVEFFCCVLAFGFVLDGVTAVNHSSQNNVPRACYHLLWCITELLMLMLIRG